MDGKTLPFVSVGHMILEEKHCTSFVMSPPSLLLSYHDF